MKTGVRASPTGKNTQAPAIKKGRIGGAEVVPDLGAADVHGFLVPLALCAIRRVAGNGSRNAAGEPGSRLTISLRVERIAVFAVKRVEHQVDVRPRPPTARH